MEANRDKDALYAAWHDNRRSAAPDSLTQWLESHPGDAADLISWAAAEPVLDYAASIEVDPESVARVASAGRLVVAEARARYDAPLSGLVAAAKSHGWSAEAFARRVGLGTSVVTKLDRRLIRFDTLPTRLIRALANALGVAEDGVRAYLQRPPTLSPSASYKADRAPRVTPQQGFTEAIRACGEMDAEQKADWLDTSN